MVSISFLWQKRAASTSEISLLIGLLSIAIIGAVTSTGDHLEEIFNKGAQAVNEAIPDTYKGEDKTPDAFLFTPITDASPGTPVFSNQVTVTGINTPIQASLTGGSFKVNNGEDVTSATLKNGDVITLSLISSNTYGETLTARFIAHDYFVDWEVTTLTNEAPTWAAQTLTPEIPVIKSYPVLTAITLPEAIDEDEDELTYSAVGDLKGFVFDSNTRTLTGTPTQHGFLSLKFNVSDGLETTSATFTLPTSPEPEDCNSIPPAYNSGSGTYKILANKSAGSEAISATCDMVTSGGGWTKFWWYNGGNQWPSSENDVLGHDFGTFAPDNSYGFQTLPSNLSQGSTELLAKDGSGTIYYWNFNQTGTVADDVFAAFKNRTSFNYPNNKGSSGTWNPTVISGSFGAANQDSFMYRTENGVKSFILDDDNCDCSTTLSAGHNMCQESWSSTYGPSDFGVDNLNDPGCSTPSGSRSLTLFYRNAAN